MTKLIIAIIVIFAIAYFFSRYSITPKNSNLSFAPSPTTQQLNSSTAVLGEQTKTTGCQINGPLQDPSCTPGAVFPNATKDQICVPGYSRSVRNVPVSEKRQVYEEYGLHYPQKAGSYEADHLISLELGGSNDIANLWPEAAEPTPGFHQKDMVENYLHDQVCSGAISLQEAQKEISTNWLDVYNTMPDSFKQPYNPSQ